MNIPGAGNSATREQRAFSGGQFSGFSRFPKSSNAKIALNHSSIFAGVYRLRQDFLRGASDEFTGRWKIGNQEAKGPC